jgi:hypothetical protein
MKNKVQLNSVVPWGDRKIIWANSKNLLKCQELIKSGAIDGIGLSPYHNSDIFDLKPFAEMNNLRGLVLPYARDINLECLHSMTFLEFLVISNATMQQNLSGMNSLTDLSVDWNKKLILPDFSASLRHLRIDKLSVLDLKELTKFSNLTKLELVKGAVESLKGCEKFCNFDEIKLYYMPKLKSVKALAQTQIKKIYIERCPNIEDLECLSKCQALEELGYHDSAALKSIDFVKKCRTLKSFRFVGVDVMDGNMKPLLHLEDFAFTNKKHFSHNEKELRSEASKLPSQA